MGVGHSQSRMLYVLATDQHRRSANLCYIPATAQLENAPVHLRFAHSSYATGKFAAAVPQFFELVGCVDLMNWRLRLFGSASHFPSIQVLVLSTSGLGSASFGWVDTLPDCLAQRFRPPSRATTTAGNLTLPVPPPNGAGHSNNLHSSQGGWMPMVVRSPEIHGSR